MIIDFYIRSLELYEAQINIFCLVGFMSQLQKNLLFLEFEPLEILKIIIIISAVVVVIGIVVGVLLITKKEEPRFVTKVLLEKSGDANAGERWLRRRKL